MQVLNDLHSYENGEWKYVTPDGEVTDSEFHYLQSGGVKGWNVRLGTILHSTEHSYVECLSERYADRANDEYEPEATLTNTGSLRKEERSYSDHPGYDITGKGHVRCWYCDGSVSLTEFRSGWEPLADAQRRMVVAMLAHYYECKSENAATNGQPLPWVRTYIRVGIRRPNGTMVPIPESARRVTRPWQVKGALL